MNESADVLWQRPWARVTELVAQEEQAIRAIADALLECPVLSGARVARLFRAAHPERLPQKRLAVGVYP
jgi:hypothetical protein